MADQGFFSMRDNLPANTGSWRAALLRSGLAYGMDSSLRILV
jgi:hypothetical protein